MNEVTNVSLKAIGGAPAVVWNGYSLHSRERYTDGLDEPASPNKIEPPTMSPLLVSPESKKGYELFPNLDSAARMLVMCEFFERPPVSQSLSGSDMRSGHIDVSDTVDPDALLAAFGICKPTRTELNNAKKAIQNWCYASDASSAIPVKDILAMSRDLRALLTMLLFTIGTACKTEMLARNASAGLTMLDAEACGCECYRRHTEDIPPHLLPGGISGARRDYEDWILPMIERAFTTGEADGSSMETMRDFCNTLISAMLSPLAPVLTSEGFFAAGEYASLGGAYAYWVNESLRGKAGVCEHCGNLFIRERSNKRFCSDTCKVTAHNKAKH